MYPSKLSTVTGAAMALAALNAGSNFYQVRKNKQDNAVLFTQLQKQIQDQLDELDTIIRKGTLSPNDIRTLKVHVRDAHYSLHEAIGIYDRLGRVVELFLVATSMTRMIQLFRALSSPLV